jgi:hypothetical protein
VGTGRRWSNLADRTPRSLRSYAPAASAYVGSRLAVLIALWACTHMQAGLRLRQTPLAWDGSWFQRVAVEWYPTSLPIGPDGKILQNTTGFFPLYPGLARLLARLPGVSVTGALATISLVGGLVTTCLVWKLGARLWDRRTADRAAVLFCFFPSSFVFSLAYSEGLMLALSVGCLLCLVDRRWVLAGVLGLLATATRSNALALELCALWSAFVAIRASRDWRSLAAPVLVPLGFVLFHVYLLVHVGRLDAYNATQRDGWDQVIDPLAMFRLAHTFVRAPFGDVNVVVALAGIPVAAVGLVLLWRAKPPLELVIYSVAVLGVCMLTPALGGRPRFLLTAFPLFYGVARLRWLSRQLIPIFASTMGMLTVLVVGTSLVTP